MNENDPFAGFGAGGETIIKPSAGRGARVAVPAGPAAQERGGPELPLEALMQSSLNPLVAAAAPLLATAPRVAAMPRHPDPQALRQALADGIRKFEAQARAQGLPNEQVIGARYILCTLLDEAASSTPWGSASHWAGKGLLVEFHNEAFGGDSVFMLLAKLAQNVDANRNLLELLYVTLAFGFKGRYATLADGRTQIESVRERLAQMLAQSRGGYEKELAPHWRGAPTVGNGRLRDGIPVWIAASVAASTLALVFFGLRLATNISTDPVATALGRLDVKAASLPVPAAAPPAVVEAVKPRLKHLLEREIAARQVAVQDLPDRSIVTIQGDSVFQPGSADVPDRVKPLLERIGEALRSTPGQVLVAGHTDSQPMRRSLRFPSNFHLSQARAQTVMELLAAQVPAARLRAEGRADTQPVDPANTTPAHERNRRVEIILLVPAAA